VAAIDNLIPGESIVVESTKHWIAPVRDSIWAALLIVGAFLVGWISPSKEGGLVGVVSNVLDLLRIGLFAVGVGWIIYNVILWRTAEFAVTNLRVLRYEGLVQRRTSETLLTSVTDVRLNVGVLGKALGYGDLRIFSASGAAGEDEFKTITGPTEFRNAMMARKMQEVQAAQAPQAQTGPGTGSAPAPVAATPTASPAAAAQAAATTATTATAQAGAADALQQLADLRDRGLITTEEYEAKKADILQRL